MAPSSAGDHHRAAAVGGHRRQPPPPILPAYQRPALRSRVPLWPRRVKQVPEVQHSLLQLGRPSLRLASWPRSRAQPTRRVGATVTAVQVVFPAAQLESAEAATEFEDRLGRKGIIVENARAATLAVSISTRVVAQTTSVTANDARTGFGIASAVQTDTARGIMAAAAQAAASAATQLETVEVTTEFADFLGPQGIVVDNAMAVTSAVRQGYNSSSASHVDHS